TNNSLVIQKRNYSNNKIVPDVHGMGARDAVYLLEQRGLKVKIIGRGKVIQQSLAPGNKIKKGEACIINLG
ncbi:PASTA domain-containing protein, partial [Brevibacterium sp. UMB10442]|nr:PASTA domain-containing protein [Brevibacterium sp. UMB10442]